MRRISEFNESLYRGFVSPSVQVFATPWTAMALRWLHPMRTSRHLFSEKFCPWTKAVETMAPWVREHRQPVEVDNPLRMGEQAASRMISNGLEACRRWRDETQEVMFAALFG